MHGFVPCRGSDLLGARLVESNGMAVLIKAAAKAQMACTLRKLVKRGSELAPKQRRLFA